MWKNDTETGVDHVDGRRRDFASGKKILLAAW